MSRFWAGASSSESDSSDDDSSYYSSDDDKGNAAGAVNRWADLSDSDSDESEARVAKSGKERAIETFNKHIAAIRNAMKNRDYYQIQTEFDLLAKAMVKNKKTLQQGVPRPLVRILCDLEDYVPERLADKAAFKKLSARQGRALNRMKLTLKKHNKPYAVVMEHYRKNPDTGDDDDNDDNDDGSDDSDSDSSSSSSSSSSSNSSGSDKKKKDSDDDSDADDDDDDDDDEDDESDWGSDSSSSSSSDSEVGGAYKGLEGRAKWLKKNTVTSKKKTKDPNAPKVKKVEAKKESLVSSKDHEAIRAPKSILPEEGLTAAMLNKKVQEIASQRGRRGTDPRQLLRQFEGLSRLSMKFGPRIEIPILMYVISAQFGLQRTMDDYMDTATWKACASYLERISKVIVDEGYRLGVENIDEADFVLGAAGKASNRMKAAATVGGAMEAVAADEKLVNPHTGEEETEDERAERLRVEKEAAMTDAEKKTIPVVGSLSLHMSRLEEEYTKSLQKISHHTPEYVTRLRDESKLVVLLSKMQSYFEREGMTTEAAQMAELHIEHIYYRHDSIARQVDKAAEYYETFGEVAMLHPACVSNQPGGSDPATSHPAASSGKPVMDEANSVAEKTDYGELMNKLCTYVYKHGTEQARKRSTICHVYHHALHDRFTDARDLLLMSHLQENIYDVGDITTMILFNRMMAQLGMCAFRQGKIWECHQCLTEVCSGKVRELLAQGVSLGRFSDKTPEQEKAEKRRQVPYYQHINLDLLEACHLISAMLLEVPNMAAASMGGDAAHGRRARPISRAFRKHQDIYAHQVFTGPPEQTRDYVMRAAKALSKGDWKSCVDLCTDLDVWNLVPGDGSAEAIKMMLASKIKLEGLRTYMFAFSAQYDSLSLDQLCGMFEMSKNDVHSVVSKMMINRELYASWDQPTATIVLRKVEPSPVQVMALQFAEKASNLVEANERLLDATTGNDQWKGRGGDRGDQNDENRFGNRGGRGGYQQGGYQNRGNKQSGGRHQKRDGGNRGRGQGRGGRGRGRKSGGGRGGQRRDNKRY